MSAAVAATISSKPAYSPGLEGVIAGESAICSLDGDVGLNYRGYGIYDLASHATFAEIIYLLFNGELPTASQLDDLNKKLIAEQNLPNQIVLMLKLLPKQTHPMDALRTGVSMLAGFDDELTDNSHAANERKALRIIAKMPAICCAFHRICNGQEPVSPKAALSPAANFLYMLSGEQPEDWKVKAMDVLYALYAEHDFNASTFAARTTVSTLSDIYAGIVTAIGALKGPLHGGANEEAMKMFLAIGKPENAEAWVKDRLAKKDKIMGFGHRVYKNGDSRSKVLHGLCKEIGERLGQPHWLAVGEILERVMGEQKKLYSNADLYAAPVFHMLQIPTDLNTPIFACSRASGWCAHIIEQHDANRLIRPRSWYTGVKPRAFEAMDRR